MPSALCHLLKAVGLDHSEVIAAEGHAEIVTPTALDGMAGEDRMAYYTWKCVECVGPRKIVTAPHLSPTRHLSPFLDSFSLGKTTFEVVTKSDSGFSK